MKKMIAAFLPLAITLVLTLVMSSSSHASEQISVSDVWAKPFLLAGGNGAGFFKLTNHTAQDDELLRIEADVSKTVELHTMSMEGNIMRMRKLDSVALPANGEVVFAPGGNHVMFIGVKSPLKEGDSFPVTLVFKHAGSIKASMKVQNAPTASAPGADTSSHGMNMN